MKKTKFWLLAGHNKLMPNLGAEELSARRLYIHETQNDLSEAFRHLLSVIGKKLLIVSPVFLCNSSPVDISTPIVILPDVYDS